MTFPVMAETTGHCGWSWRYQHSKSGVDGLVNMDNLLSRNLSFLKLLLSKPVPGVVVYSQTRLSNSNIPIFSVLVFSTGIFSLVGTTVFAAGKLPDSPQCPVFTEAESTLCPSVETVYTSGSRWEQTYLKGNRTCKTRTLTQKLSQLASEKETGNLMKNTSSWPVWWNMFLLSL